MKIFIIILLILIAIIFLVIIISPQKLKSSYEDKLKTFLLNNKINFTLTKAEHHSYNYNLKINNIVYLIKLVTVPVDADIQINNKITWEIKFGAGKSLGKAQPNSTYMGNNINIFMNLKVSDNAQKVVVILPHPRKIVMYINECEIIFVKPSTNVYGARVISCEDFSLFKQNICSK